MLRLLHHRLEVRHISTPVSKHCHCNISMNGPIVFSSNSKTITLHNNCFIKLTAHCSKLPKNVHSLPHSGKSVETHTPQINKSFWGAVSLIIGTAVGPGILGLPAVTIQSGPLPSCIVIILCWVYVISSILLVVELSFSAMEQNGVEEVSFTGLATDAFGFQFGVFVSLVYASLSFSLLVACVSGIGSIISQWFPWMHHVIAHALFPLTAGVLIGGFPFNVIDSTNRFLCFIMIISITLLVGIGMSIGRENIIASFSSSSWRISSILPAIPVTVLTLGFHVITPFVCKIAGNSVIQARKAVLLGGMVPLIMVLSWNLIVLGLVGKNSAASSNDAISLLLSVNPCALSAVQGFAFSALATSLIGYAVSFPKQLIDTFELISRNPKLKINVSGRVGVAIYSDLGNSGCVSFNRSRCLSDGVSYCNFVLPLILGSPVLLAAFYSSSFSRALNFAGVYANCFLFGILPPLMAYVQQSRKKLRSKVVPGGNYALFLLFSIALVLGIWH